MEAGGSLPQSMCVGGIVLLYKDTGDRAGTGNHKPITLLNADYKVPATLCPRLCAIQRRLTSCMQVSSLGA